MPSDKAKAGHHRNAHRRRAEPSSALQNATDRLVLYSSQLGPCKVLSQSSVSQYATYRLVLCSRLLYLLSCRTQDRAR